MIAISPKAVEQLAVTRQASLASRPVLTIAGMTTRREGQVINRDKPGTLATGHVVGLGLGAEVGTAIFSAEPPQTEAPYGVAVIDGHTLRFTLDGQDSSVRGRNPSPLQESRRCGCYVVREKPPFVKGYWVAGGDSVDAFIKSWRASAR